MNGLETFEFNPFETTEDDIQKFFGGGDFFLEPIGHNHKILSGRLISIDAPRRGAMSNEQAALARPTMQQNAPQEEAQPLFGRRSNPFSPAAQPEESMIKHVVEALESKAKAVEEMSSKKEDIVMQFANRAMDTVANNSRQPQVSAADLATPLVDSLRRQLEELHTRHTEEIRRLHRENDEERARMRSDIDRRDRAQDDARRASQETERETRQRYERDLDELRKRYDRQVSEEAERYSRKLKDLENELSTVRSRLEKELIEERAKSQKRIYELEKENLELTRELASIPEPEENNGKSNAATEQSGGPNLPDDAPWWAGMIPDVIQAVTGGRGIGRPPQQSQQQLPPGEEQQEEEMFEPPPAQPVPVRRQVQPAQVQQVRPAQPVQVQRQPVQPVQVQRQPVQVQQPVQPVQVQQPAPVPVPVPAPVVRRQQMLTEEQVRALYNQAESDAKAETEQVGVVEQHADAVEQASAEEMNFKIDDSPVLEGFELENFTLHQP